MTLIYLLIGISFSIGSLFMAAFAFQNEGTMVEGPVNPVKRSSGFQQLSLK